MGLGPSHVTKLCTKVLVYAIMPCTKNQVDIMITSKVITNSIFWNLIGLCMEMKYDCEQ